MLGVRAVRLQVYTHRTDVTAGSDLRHAAFFADKHVRNEEHEDPYTDADDRGRLEARHVSGRKIITKVIVQSSSRVLGCPGWMLVFPGGLGCFPSGPSSFLLLCLVLCRARTPCPVFSNHRETRCKLYVLTLARRVAEPCRA